MVELNEISRVVLPDANYSANTELFVRLQEKSLKFFDVFERVSVYHFNTWMNTFAAKKYYDYCELGNLFLKVKVNGRAQIKIVGSNRNSDLKCVYTNLASADVSGEAVIPVENAKDYEGIYFDLITPADNSCNLISASWCTDKSPLRDNKLAIICCTFKREDYIKKNIRLFEKFKAENPDLQKKINLFISDNGKTLPAELNSANVRIYPNMNAGGAGGFTRGVMEVMALNEGYTRVLFMDDDVEMFPESFYRTLMLANYLKEEYQDAVINGAMLDLYNKAMFFESMAVQTSYWVKPYHPRCNLNEYHNVLNANLTSKDLFSNPNKKISSAWWFCSFTLETFKEKGLPLPVFFRCDDIEYSWRNFGKHHIQMNGICVWHAPFNWRTSKVVDYYYSKRNFFMINMIYTPNYKKQFLHTLKRDFNVLLQRYDYITCEIYLKTIEDLLAGAATFRQNPEEQFKNINAINKKRDIQSCGFEEIKIAMQHKPHAKKWRRLVYSLTKNGLCCPDFCFKSGGISLDCAPPVKDFILNKEVKVYNLLYRTYELRKFDRKRMAELQNEFKKQYDVISSKYDSLSQEFKQMHGEMTTTEFWRKYLELPEVNTAIEREKIYA